MKTLSPVGLPSFTTQYDVALVYLHAPFLPRFNALLLAALPAQVRESLGAAQVDFAGMLTAMPEYAVYLGAALNQLGVPNRKLVLPGYYLFCEGSVRDWHLGGPERADFRRLAVAGTLGWVSGHAMGMPRLPWLALQFVNEQTAAKRMADQFAAAVTSRGGRSSFSWQDWAREHRAGQNAEARASVAAAYETLGVTPSMSDAEIRRAFRSKCRATHPDLATEDPVEQARRTRELQRINAAYELLQRVRSSATP